MVAGSLAHMDAAHAGSATGEADGTHADGTDAVVFFWRPACGFCASLRRSLDALGIPLVEIDIWEDPRAAAAVRAITGGDETVPTVVVGDAALVNPSAQAVVAAVEDHLPHLLRG